LDVGARDIVVIGASAGGIEVLTRLVSGLPSNLPASIFVVVHIPAWRKSELPAVLNYSSRIPALNPGPDEPIRPGRIYVAPADHHLLLSRPGIVTLSHGPKENRHRPAVDPLFRSAAATYGPRVAGLILSGALDDGAAGLWWVKRHGGVAIVQDPREASFPCMPYYALERAPADYIIHSGEMAGLLTELIAGADPLGYGVPAEEVSECIPRKL